MLVLGGCSSEPTVPVIINETPTITFTFAPAAVPIATSVELTVAVDDADDDPLTVTWAATGGTLVSPQGGTEMTWFSGGALGSYDITMTVQDDKGAKRTIVHTIRVGTLRDVDIAGTVTFTKVNSPYIVRPASANTTIFSVPVGTTLIIEAGVEVLIDRVAMLFDIEGTLDVNGTAAEPVSFQSNFRDPQPGDWSGFQVKSQSPTNATVTMDYGIVGFASIGFKSAGGSDITLRNSTVRFSTTAAIQQLSSGALRVTDCTIVDNLLDGIAVTTIATPPDLINIQGNKIAFNGIDGGDGAIHLRINDPFGLLPISITGNNISRNFNIGIVLEVAVYPTIQGNGIFSNTFGADATVNIRLENFTSGQLATVDATQNFWIITDENEIKGTIHDKQDDFNLASTVDVTSWLTSCPTTSFPFEDEVTACN